MRGGGGGGGGSNGCGLVKVGVTGKLMKRTPLRVLDPVHTKMTNEFVAIIAVC